MHLYFYYFLMFVLTKKKRGKREDKVDVYLLLKTEPVFKIWFIIDNLSTAIVDMIIYQQQ